MTLSTRHESRFAKCCYYCREITTFLFSHIGLCALVFGYSIVGAFTFRALEAPNELKHRKFVIEERLSFTDKLWTITQNSTVLKQKEWSDRVAKELEKLEKSLVFAFKYNGYDGKDDTHENSLQWNFFGALLYSIIVITTIGYGNIAPKTRIGKLVTILYAIIGIPLMLLFLSNIGDAMANSFKFLYWKVCCILCVNPKKSRKQRQHRRRRRKQRHMEQIAMQTMPITTETMSTSPTTTLYPSIPRTIANRQSHRNNNERDLGSVPIICNMYALEANHLEELPEQNAKPFGTYLPNRPFSTLPHNFCLASNNSSNHLTAQPTIAQPNRNPIGFQRVVTQRTVDGSDYSSDESFESDSQIQDIPNVPITLCIALVVSYICGGGFLFQFLEKWTFLDASYFSFVTLTTIGFGDLVPGTDVFSREDAQTILGICALYLLFGMALLAMSFNLVKEEVTKKIRFIGKRIGILTKDESDYESD